MNYYEVIPATNNFHGKEPLTYSSEEEMFKGQIVNVPLRDKLFSAVIVRAVDKPSFKTLKINEIVKRAILPDTHLKLLEWMDGFYPGYLGAVAQLFVPGSLDLDPEDIIPDKASIQTAHLPALTDDQQRAVKEFRKEKHNSYILHGITGSGKTRIYIEEAKKNIKEGKSVIILTPEISLTTPLYNQLNQVFGSKVKINHSSLTPKKKRNLWSKLFLDKEPMILIGPRSTLFLPVKNIGLIVVDEFHESAYKQESAPFYSAIRVASKLSQLSNSKIIFGSATPPIGDYYLALNKKVPIIKLDRPAITQNNPPRPNLIVDLLKPEEKSSYPLVSKTLIDQLKLCLSNGEQAMLFINKRGSARSISCQECGYRELCPRCDLPLIYHSDEHKIRCHTCGYKKDPPAKCPVCSSIKIYFNNPGTKAIADNISRLFPKATIGRFDKDNKKSERMENNYDSVVKDIDIIVGTQTIAKGHDLPRLSLVAVLLAENGLNFPDFSSEEKSYQLIKQLSGRINRGHREGTLVIQTFHPDSDLIKSILNQSWEDFYSREIKQRERHGFPPFYSAIKIESSRKSRQGAEKSLNDLLKKLDLETKNLEILGPAPNFVEKKASKWHWQVIIKSKKRSDLTDIAQNTPSSFRIDIDPVDFL